jgi:DinB superfamily
MDDSSIRQSALKQYRAGLDMLGKAIELCPEEVWFSSDFRNRFWHIAYHSVFYTHLYVHPSESDFQPFARHAPNSQYLGPRPWAKDEPFQLPAPYTKQDLQEYLALCRTEVERQVPLVRLEDGSGFSWLPFNKLELQFYNIRHLQHHAGQLAEMLRNAADVGVGWVGSR